MSPLVSEFRLLQTVSARGSHPNVLIVCEDRFVDAVVSRVARWSAQPFYCCAADNWRLPAHGGGTLVVKHLWSLTSAQQTALFEWMNAHGQSTQVVSVTRPGFQGHAGNGAFLEALFFRLNILQIEISCGRTDVMTEQLTMAG